MPIETATFLKQLNSANPAGTDQIADGDNHIRLIKQVLLNTFPNIDQAVAAKPTDFYGLVPIGTVVAFALPTSQLPTGWAICNGLTVPRTDGGGNITTPDLRNRFVIGVSSTKPFLGAGGTETTTGTTTAVSGGTPTGITGTAGTHNHGGATTATALSLSQIPAHDHSYAKAEIVNRGSTDFNGLANNSALQYTSSNETTGSRGAGAAHDHGIVGDGAHNHTFAGASLPTHTHSVTVPNLPPYYALYYIMRV